MEISLLESSLVVIVLVRLFTVHLLVMILRIISIIFLEVPLIMLLVRI